MPNGTLVPQTGTRTGQVPTDSSSGAMARAFSSHQIQVYPQLDRYNINLLSHFEISPAAVPFVEAKYSRTEERRHRCQRSGLHRWRSPWVIHSSSLITTAS